MPTSEVVLMSQEEIEDKQQIKEIPSYRKDMRGDFYKTKWIQKETEQINEQRLQRGEGVL